MQPVQHINIQSAKARLQDFRWVHAQATGVVGSWRWNVSEGPVSQQHLGETRPQLRPADIDVAYSVTFNAPSPSIRFQVSRSANVLDSKPAIEWRSFRPSRCRDRDDTCHSSLSSHDVLAILRYDVFGNVLRANHVPAEHPLVGIRVVLHPCGTEVVLTVHSRREDEEAQAADLGVSRVTPLASSGARLWSRSLNP